ncbi:MAG: penicillin-binding protein 2 [Gemmatimonadetes bacterium]|nr:penicillin-binding protein 2 [Gemmatimonadota bacterium]NNM05521.1 penicillin-binding protein 2 [Gemmatimonadota bacterium]
MRLDHPISRRSRAQGGTALVVILMSLLMVAFFRAQVLRKTTWELQADNNRLRQLGVPAPRGTIFDRNGKIIADNVPGWEVVLLPDNRDTIRARLESLRSHLELTDGRIDRLMETVRAYPRQPLTVKVNAPFDQVSALEERKSEFPGLYLVERPRRRYLAGEAMGHILGYLGEITEEELDDPAFSQDALGRYVPGAIIGKDGIEKQYERTLQGQAGFRYVEVDVLGRIVGSFQGPAVAEAVPGENISLNIDLELQEWVHQIFPDTMRGAVVALDVEDGGVLALYSSPIFDSNDFVGGISSDEWATLLEDPARPLLNRAVQGIYPPGSTWKLATAAIGLDLGVVRPDEIMPIPCTGGMSYGNGYSRCWNPEGHGAVDLVGAIRHSCNVYFYQLGLRIGLRELLEEGTRIGFNQRCGIDLPSEARGNFPDDPTWWERAPQFGYRATEGEVLSLAIGQGPNSQTPLKMAQFYVAIARDGSAPPPKLLKTEGSPEGGWSLALSREALETMREGLRGVVQPGGTAYLSSLEHWDLMGKTGTVQNPPNPDHAWFTGIAGPRGGDPEIVVVVIVEFGESGSGVAAPLVSKTADYYLRRKYGIPVDSIQTLREHYLTGTPAPWAETLSGGNDGEDEP